MTSPSTLRELLLDIALAVVLSTLLGWLAGAVFAIWMHNRNGGES